MISKPFRKGSGMLDWLSHVNVNDLLKSGVGAVIGFSLAQVVNLARSIHEIYVRPQLRLSAPEFCIVGDPLYSEHGNPPVRYYGFKVKNTGRRVATNVQFQIEAIERKPLHHSDYQLIDCASQQLFTFNPSKPKEKGADLITLPPGGAAVILMATWDRSDTVFRPSGSIPRIELKECAGQQDYRLSVIAFEAGGRYTREKFWIRITIGEADKPPPRRVREVTIESF